jgi:hypothetical protein
MSIYVAVEMGAQWQALVQPVNFYSLLYMICVLMKKYDSFELHYKIPLFIIIILVFLAS